MKLFRIIGSILVIVVCAGAYLYAQSQDNAEQPAATTAPSDNQYKLD